MDLSLERDSSSALGSLFQQIINDLKNTSPLWEDFVTKATKLHQCLRAAIQAIAAYLDAFQKIADAATNSRGASKEIGTALTRVCLRHKAVESRLKTFTTAIMDCLVQPLQEKLEDWKRTVITIDKEHAKEYKRCRTELKKRSSDTLRLQKKARKGQSDTIQSLMDSHKQDVTLRRAELEEVEKKSLRSAMIEERLRYCTFVHMLQPVVKEECEVMSELGHLQEAMDSIALVTKEPSVLPQASEELIHDTKATMSLYPESPGGGSSSQGGCSNSLGSRKSSVCSISSMNSSGSSNSPGHHHYPRSLSQASTATSQSHAVSTWPPHSQDAVPVLPPASDRPHTISTAYEKGHQRPPLTVYTFQNPETILEGSGGSGSIPGTPNGTSGGPGSGANTPSTQKSPAGALSRPPLPVRCSSLERPLSANNNRSTNNLLQRQCPSPIPAHITKELSAHHAQQHMQQQQQTQQLQQLLQTSSPPPTYVNMSELANMAAAKITNQQQQQQRPVAALQQQHSIDSISSQFSNDSTASGNQQSQQQQHQTGVMVSGNNNSTGSKTRSHSVSSSSASSNTPSLHSHPSIESGTIATPLVGQTPTPSSGSSTPQNHYSPLLTNSPSSTAAGTPSGGSVTSGMLSGFVYNVNSPTPPQSGTASVDSDVLKITETDAAGQPTIVPIHETNTQQQETSNANNNAICIESQTTPTETSEQTCTNAIDSTATANDTESPTIVENDERSRASVLQKASMFEKQAAAAAGSTAAVTPGRSTVEAIYGTRRTPDEVYRTANPSIGGNHYQQPSPHQQQQPQQQQQHVEQQEVDKSFEDSIQELNNLIGELDSFQREIDASKRATATTTAVSQATTADGTVGDNCGDRPFPLIGTSSNSVVADNNKMGNNAKAITTLATVVTEAERVDMTTALTVICPPRPPKSPQCASNQTSGCGTDLSDTASDDVAADVGSLTSINNNHNNNNNTKGSNNNEHNASLSSRESCATGHDNNVRTLQQYNSDSELSRCYVSETSSLAGGYENPTFAHFATAVSSSSIAASSGVDEPADVGSVIGDNRSLMAVSSTTTADDCASHTSDTYQMPQQAADNGSDGGSNVVVIYDHQIPMTPDIDYVKQNSEIVVLRTKDPLQQQLGRQEMRELTQLPTSLCAPHDGLATPGAGMMSVLALSSSSLSCLGPNSPPHTATVAPAKQRLSSFRASSEQQLQLLGCGDNNNSGSELSLLRTPHHHHQQYANAGTPQAQTECSKEGSRRVATPPNAHNMHADTIIRRKAAIPPPKPSLSIFNGQAADHLSLEANASVRKSSSSSCRGSCEAVVERLTATPTPPPPLLTKANFKADLDAKIRKQKLKLQLQHEQQQHHELLLQKQQLLQEQQQLQHSPQSAANNTNSSIYLSNHSHNNLNHNNSNNTTINNITTTNTTTNSGVGNGLGNRNSSSGASSNTHNNSNNNNCNAISLNKRSCSTAMSNATTTKTTTASASASASASNHLAFVVKAASSHHHTNASASSSLAGPQLVYQNGTKSSSNNRNMNNNSDSSRNASAYSSAYPKTSKQIHSNRTHYQFHALKSHNNNNMNNKTHTITTNTNNNINAKTRPKRSASMSSTQKSSNAIRASSPSLSTISTSPSSLLLCTPAIRASTERLVKCPPTPPLPLRSQLVAHQKPKQQQQHAHIHNPTNNHSVLSTTSSSSSSSSPSSVSVSTCAYACSSACATPTPPTIHTKQSAASASVSSASASASNSNINSANAKPNITPRPASLSGGVTRIARRSSVNTAKPPPPVRRSSSVTPSHTATGTAATQSPQQNQQQQQQQHQHYQQLHHLHPHANQQLTSATTTTIQNSPYDTVESLPPPPAYLLDSRQAQSSTPTPPPPSAVSATAIPSSSLKVAETVKALSAMRHKPASPNAIRHMQQQQQQQLQQSHQSLQYSPTPTPTPSSPSPTPIQLQQNIYSTTVKTFSSTALLPPDCNTEQTLHYDAYSYYNPYMEVRTTTQLTSAKMPLTNANHANDAKEAAYQTLPITPTPIYYYDAVTMQPTTMATTPTKSKHLQSNALQDTYGVNTALRTTPNKTNNPPVSPSYTSPPPYDFQHSKIELPPPLPPPNPNQQRSLKQQQQKQFVDHQYNTPATCTLQPSQYQHNNNQLQPKRQHEQIYDYLPSHQHLHSPKPQHKPQPQPQQQTSQIQQQQQLAHNIDALMIDNEDEPTVYSDNASFRTSSPGIYAQPKIVTSMSSFRSASPAPTNDHHNQHHHVIPPTQPKTNPNLIAQLSARLSKQNQQQHTGDGIYGSTPNSPNHHNMHQQQLQQQQHQHQHHQSEPVYMRNYTHPHHQQHQPHQQQQMPSVATGSMHQQQNYDAAQTPKHQSSYAHAGGVARQQQQQQQQQHHSHHREPHTHSCPPPLENPPPPPTNSSIYAATANATATMPKNATRSNVSATYAPPTSTMTLPKNLAQQRLQQQQHYQQQQQHYQQQQYQQSIATGANAAAQQHHQAQQHSQTTTVNQRAQMPLPYQQQQQMSYKQKSATLQSNHRQPPIPSRHSSVQQKIFVATNPFIQTTTIHCHSPASVHSQPASPTCSSPSSLASIYGTSSRSHHHHHHQQQQQQQHQHHGSGSGVGGGTAGNGFYAAPHNSTSYASSNIEKAGSIRSKTKAEFLENLNAKLAKQGLSGRAFAVRNLINSKALMYQNPQTLMRPSAQYRAQPQAPPTPPTSSAEESSSH
ncbi:streptococcal hemagglutinin isoform X2 [Bactrocera oleae]|uniref:streptococcal hemagglutinin isoform X2 n=1 Tax=Bactrocera oleae TaxID=104688 RepID=UPI00387ECD6B